MLLQAAPRSSTQPVHLPGGHVHSLGAPAAGGAEGRTGVLPGRAAAARSGCLATWSLTLGRKWDKGAHPDPSIDVLSLPELQVSLQGVVGRGALLRPLTVQFRTGQDVREDSKLYGEHG